MKRGFAILMLMLYLVANTELHQLAKLPAFFEHYQVHKTKDPGVDLLAFTILHYIKGDGQDARHEQLPFKSADCHIASVLIAAPPEEFVELACKDSYTMPSKAGYTCPLTVSEFHFSIWQPPRNLSC
jgi:hypothetical protein